MSESKEFSSRGVQLAVLSVEQAEGVGARVRRSIGRPELRNFDPFLMLDEFKVAPPAGFPDHPHRGFETVTYMLPSTKGSFEHEDFCGHKGKIGPGDLQWMTAGKGIVHSEMPASSAISHGLQLWVNLPRTLKLCDPAYQELKSSDIPQVTKDGVTAIVIAGEALGTKSGVYTRQPVHYLHFKMEPNSRLEQPIPAEWNAFCYVCVYSFCLILTLRYWQTISGELLVGTSKTKHLAHHTVALDQNGTGVLLRTNDVAAEFVLISGKPTGEPIVQYGPMVMCTQAEIQQAFQDYQYGRNGFEKAPGWRSEIGRPITDRR